MPTLKPKKSAPRRPGKPGTPDAITQTGLALFACVRTAARLATLPNDGTRCGLLGFALGRLCHTNPAAALAFVEQVNAHFPAFAGTGPQKRKKGRK